MVTSGVCKTIPKIINDMGKKNIVFRKFSKHFHNLNKFPQALHNAMTHCHSVHPADFRE